MLRRLQSALLAVIFCLLSLNPGLAKDIRGPIVNETDLEKQVESFCLQYCQGNERKGYLKSVTVDKIDNGRYSVVGKAALQNRHVIRDPLEFVLFDRIVIVNAFGTLNPDNCELRVDNVSVENDFQDIFNSLLRNQKDIIGRVEKVPNCARFIE